MMTESKANQPCTEPVAYRIKIAGHLDSEWTDWFAGFTITQEANGITLLCGTVPDQSALFGLLKQLHNMGLTLLLVDRHQ